MISSSYRLQLPVILLIFFFSSSYGQNQYVKGYVLPVGKDTIKCLIEVRDSFWRIKELKIKKEENSELIKMPLEEISAFRITSGYEELYLVRVVDIDMKPVDGRTLEEGVTKQIVRQTLPLKVLVIGKVSLMTHTDENRKRHFFYQKDNNIHELNYVKYLMANGLVAEFEEYKQQLKNLFSDCSKMSAYRGSLSEGPLVKAFQAYNQCLGGAVYTAKKEKSKLTPNFIIGMNSNTLKYNGADNYSTVGASDASYNPSGGFLAGVSLDFVSAQRPRRLMFSLELLFSKTSTITGVKSGDYIPSTYHLDFTAANFNIAGRYVLSQTGMVHPYLKFGVGFNYLLQSNTSGEIVDLSGSAHHYSPLIDFRKIGPDLLVGAGCSLKRFSVELRYQYNVYGGADGIGTVVSLGTSGLLLGYRLRK